MRLEQIRFLKFCVVGASGVLVNMAVFSGTHSLARALDATLRFNTAQLAGFCVSCFSNFGLNDVWTWGDRTKTNTRTLLRLRTYYLVGLSAYLVQAGAGNLLLVGTGMSPWRANLAGILLATMLNFVLNNRVTFAPARNG
jgi:dolichol-phosphate mannosyltransferase